MRTETGTVEKGACGLTEKEMNEAKKKYLTRYKKSHLKWLSLCEQEKSIRAEIEGARSPEITDMPRAARTADLSDWMVRLEMILEKIDAAKKENYGIRAEIEERIIDMDDGIQSRILWLRYIDFKEWNDICTRIGYSWNRTHELHSEALLNFPLEKTVQKRIE